MCRVLRFHGSEDKKTFTHVGYNSRLDELQAAILLELRPLVDGWNDGRIAVAARYEELGLGEHVVLPAVAAGARHVYHLYVVRSQERERLVAGLTRGRHRQLALLLDAAAPAAGVRAPRLRRGLAAGDRALLARMRRAADVADARRGGRSARSCDAVTALAPART